MKKFLQYGLTFLIAIGLTAGATARADGGGGQWFGGGGNQDGNSQGDDDQGDGHGGFGNHRHGFGFLLQPATGAPVGASGWVAIFTDTTTGSSTLKIRTEGLAAGTYTVNVTDTSSTVTPLGTFVVADPTATTTGTSSGDDGDDNDNDNDTEATVAFPAGFDVTTVASVQVADSTGATVLNGSATTTGLYAQGCDHEHQVFDLQPTAAAPAGAAGCARVKVSDDDDSQGQNPAGPSLQVKTVNLAAGTYTVNVTSLSTGTSTTLGTFDVVTPGASTSEDGENVASIAFPAGFNTLDIASVQVADSTGTVLLNGTGSVNGCGIAGSEHLNARTLLTATSNAPTGAFGAARIDGDDQQGVNTAELLIGTVGLTAGTYTVSITSATDGSVSVLGTFVVATTTSNSSNSSCQVKFGTRAGLPLPAGFNPQDVAGVQVADATGVVMLTGSFTNTTTVSTATFAAKVHVTPGPAAPALKGTASINSHVSRHALHQAFSLAASHAPKSSTLVLKVNGNAAGTVKTSRSGSLALRSLPKSARNKKVNSVSVETGDGTQVLSVHF